MYFKFVLVYPFRDDFTLSKSYYVIRLCRSGWFRYYILSLTKYILLDEWKLAMRIRELATNTSKLLQEANCLLSQIYMKKY